MRITDDILARLAEHERVLAVKDAIHALLAVLLYFACRRTLTKKLIRYEVG